MTKELDVIRDKVNWHWRNNMRPVRFFAFDGRAALPVPLLLFHARLSTLTIMILSLLLFRFLENKGLTFPAALRNLRAWVVGKTRPGLVSIEHKKFRDFG